MEVDFKDIVRKYNGIFYKIARSYTETEVDFEDLYQEMLIQLWQSFPSFKGHSKQSTWIYRVSLNTAISYNRKKKKRITTSEIPDIGNDISIEYSDDREQKIELLYKCIYQLSKNDRALVLLHLEGKQYDEIGEVMGLSTSHVGVKLLRIRKKLQNSLIQEGYGRI